MRNSSWILLPMLWAAVACGGDDEAEPLAVSNGLGPAPFDPGETYAPDVRVAELSTTVDNRFFPAPPGARWVYEAQTDEGVERIEVSVDADPRLVNGVTATVVRDTVYLAGEMIEDTWDWYAQDPTGNVWYLGEETYEYENGQVVCDCGAWEWGVDAAALPGVLMLATPTVGVVYRQEYLPGEAEDVGQVVALDVSVDVPAGSFTGCIRTRDRSALDLEVDEYKTYCPGIGPVLEEADDERVELIEYSGL